MQIRHAKENTFRVEITKEDLIQVQWITLPESTTNLMESMQLIIELIAINYNICKDHNPPIKCLKCITTLISRRRKHNTVRYRCNYHHIKHTVYLTCRCQVTEARIQQPVESRAQN
ncbi:hypothetical protein Pfo_004084 [Paulownia fortunei]|nr:hypothetical protein Pfo_004084 [Paulownia fortunei]